MFEKFSATDIDSAGRGGEYTVQAGFGWTNGVVLWVASTYGNVLVAPTCPSLLVEASITSGNGASTSSATALHMMPTMSTHVVMIVTIIAAAALLRSPS